MLGKKVLNQETLVSIQPETDITIISFYGFSIIKDMDNLKKSYKATGLLFCS